MIGGTQQWVAKHAAETATEDCDPIAIDSMLAVRRTEAIIVTKAVT